MYQNMHCSERCCTWPCNDLSYCNIYNLQICFIFHRVSCWLNVVRLFKSLYSLSANLNFNSHGRSQLGLQPPCSESMNPVPFPLQLFLENLDIRKKLSIHQIALHSNIIYFYRFYVSKLKDHSSQSLAQSPSFINNHPQI